MRMPKCTPLRAMTVIIELKGTLWAASIMDLQAAIERFRKKWSLLTMNSVTR
jgi:hypothetical protein